MTKTTNYNLNKPDREDALNIDDLNENADIIDQELNAAATTADNAIPKTGTATMTSTITASYTGVPNNTLWSLRGIYVDNSAGSAAVSTSGIWMRRK